MSLRFYIDDSGKNDPPVFVLGGVALDVGRLEEFEAAWRSALANPPAIPFFKMKDANARQGVFKGMSSADRDAKVAALGEVLRSYAVASISVVVRHDQYRRTYKGRLMRWMDEPYQMLFHLIIATAYKLVSEKDLGSTAEFVFDRQLNEERALKESLATFRQGLVKELASFLTADPRHADDKDEVGLQAADMVAWHVRRSWRDGAQACINASPAGVVINGLPGSHDFFGEDALRYLADVAVQLAKNLNTVLPYEAIRLSQRFDGDATVENFYLLQNARPFQPVELISFPATGTGRFRLVNSCAEFDKPHLHRRSGNTCLSAESAV